MSHQHEPLARVSQRFGMRGFPIYASHGEAHCFRCGGALDLTKLRNDYWPGGGQFSAPCGSCWVRTWYDVEGAQP